MLLNMTFVMFSYHFLLHVGRSPWPFNFISSVFSNRRGHFDKNIRWYTCYMRPEYEYICIFFIQRFLYDTRLFHLCCEKLNGRHLGFHFFFFSLIIPMRFTYSATFFCKSLFGFSSRFELGFYIL